MAHLKKNVLPRFVCFLVFLRCAANTAHNNKQKIDGRH